MLGYSERLLQELAALYYVNSLRGYNTTTTAATVTVIISPFIETK